MSDGAHVKSIEQYMRLTTAFRATVLLGGHRVLLGLDHAVKGNKFEGAICSIEWAFYIETCVSFMFVSRDGVILESGHGMAHPCSSSTP